MTVRLGNVVDYSLPLGNQDIYMNELLGTKLIVTYLQKINCIHCGKETKTSFAQGYCYHCYTTLPETDAGVLRPELDQSHLGVSRDMEWAEKNSLIDHYVYLAISSGLKVGVTRHTQAITRWIDQGATNAIKLAITPNRYLAGTIEVELKKHVPDKTNWRQMLTSDPDLGINLREEKQRVAGYLSEKLKKYVTDDNWITEIRYPVIKYPERVVPVNLEKQLSFSGTLTGIKGQYLIFENDNVLNIRKYNGYLVEICV
ncbi:MAG: DUF2797 domain-containing protein [Bacteroidota bacterium]